jgi:hypothetical protein
MAPPSPAPHDGALLVRRGVLLAAAALAALLLLLLWPIAAALRDAITAGIQARGDLIATALLLIALLKAIGLLRIVFALGRKLDAQADQAAIVRLENQHPIHVADVRQGHLHLIERSLAWHYQAEQVRAERSQFPTLATLHQVVRTEGAAPLPAEAAPALISRPSMPAARSWPSSARAGTSAALRPPCWWGMMRVASPCRLS